MLRASSVTSGRKVRRTMLNARILRRPAAPVKTDGDLRPVVKVPASHRGRRGAPMARRDDREYREYLREEQRSQRGCIAGRTGSPARQPRWGPRMQPDFHHGLLTGGAGSRTPLGAIRLFLEMRARDERLQEVLGIVDDGRYGEPLIAVRLGVAIVVFGQRGALTVGHAVLSQISGLE